MRIPNFDPRDYQLDFLKAMDSGKKRAVLVWHRRAGKEIVCFNYMIRQAFWHRVGTYVYFFPTTRLGRRILWDGINKDGKRFIDYIPKEIMAGKPNEQEMKIKLTNGSVIQIIGTDLIENVGVNPVGVVFSEYSLQDSKAWTYTRPILRENGGWAVFNFTPRGRNHAHDLYLMAKNNPDWFCQLLTVDDTDVLTPEDIEAERREGMSEHMIMQEYYCNFDQGQEGSYFAKLLNDAELSGRLTNVPHDSQYSVDTTWDLGVGDETCILFTQNIGQQVHLIDMYRASGEGLAHYAHVLRQWSQDKGYNYNTHHAPHDIEVRDLSAGALTRRQIARELGINFKVVPKLPLMEGIELARGLFPKLWIDSEKCNFFIKAAENYHRQYNERQNVYSDRPVHDWSSHCFTGDTNVLTNYGSLPIMDLPSSGKVLTMDGYRTYYNPRITRQNASLCCVTFKGGYKVRCTPDHRFLTPTGWQEAKWLKKQTVIVRPIMGLSERDQLELISGLKHKGSRLEIFFHQHCFPEVESVQMLDEKEDVYCMTVPEAEHFCLENGAIVHNCMDAYRYLAVAQNRTARGVMTEEDAMNMERAWFRLRPKS